jgi:endonuclease/exonuclease/phosphatase family metal-dependent hydrolase
MYQRPGDLNLFAPRPLNISALNVQTLLKTGYQALLATTLNTFNVDVCCLSEIRLPDSGSCRLNVPKQDDSFTLYYSGVPLDGDRQGQHGVGIAVNKKLANAIIEWKPINERLAKMRLAAKPANISIIAVYAPTNSTTDSDKDEFYAALDREVAQIPANDYLVVAGDFNAQLGPPIKGRKETGPNTLGHLCGNGERLLDLATNYHLLIANTVFRHKRRHLQTWISPDGKTRNQIDHILIRKRWQNSLIDARSFWGTDAITDHALLSVKIKIKPQSRKRPTPNGKFDLPQLKIPGKQVEFASTYQREKPTKPATTLNDKWVEIKTSLSKAAKTVLGHGKKSNQDWISDRTLQLSDKRKIARSNNNHALASDLAKEVKLSARQDREAYWTTQATELESAQSRGDTKKLFRLVKIIARNYSPPVSGTILDKNDQAITEKTQLLGRWCEYFSELLNHNSPLQAIVQPTAPTQMIPYNINEEPPTIEEINRAVKQLKSGRAPGSDGLPPDLFKINNPALIADLHDLYSMIWKDESIPADWQTAIVLPLHKKGDKKRCNNYRGISLLNIAYKLMEKIMLNRLLPNRDRNTRENQAGFRPGRGCIDQIFTLRQILELRHEFRQPTVVAFLDFTAAFDSVDRESIWSLLEGEGLPPKLKRMCAAMYAKTNCRIRAYGEDSQEFSTKTGVRQGGVLSPCLFNICIDHVLKSALDNGPGGIKIYPSEQSVTDLTFADDIAMLADSPEIMQAMIDRITEAASTVGLKLNCAKSKYFATNLDPASLNVDLMIGNDHMELVNSFTYLGSRISPSGQLDEEIPVRIARASSIFAAFKHFWARPDIRTKTKTRIYCATVRATLLYATETWPIKLDQLRKMEAFDHRCLRRIAKVRWSDFITNEYVRQRCGLKHPLAAMMILRRWKWIGHVMRMPDSRLPYKTFTSLQGPTWKRPKGGVRQTTQRYFHKKAEDLIMIPFNLGRKKFNDSWLKHLRTIASDRGQWRIISNDMANAHCGRSGR